MHSKQGKIFCLGLSKTGTTSLAAALQMLGYKTRDYIGVTKYSPGDLSSIDENELSEHDAFTDTPIPTFYKELDARYPGSKFILTVRDMSDWLRSCKKQFTEKHAEKQNEATRNLTNDLYGCDYFQEDKFKAGYQRFVSEVLDYFKDRPSDLLLINVCEGEGWEKLCDFLGKPLPAVTFPVTNVTEIAWVKIEDVIGLARQAADEIPSMAKLKTISARDSGQQERDGLSVFKYWLKIAKKYVFFLLHRENVVYKIIEDGLKKRTPTTHILSGRHHDIPCSARKNWAYVWLVDVSGIGDSPSINDAVPAITIALIKSGQPKMGVVYLPTKDIVYYSDGAGGGFKAHACNVPVRLDPKAYPSSRVVASDLEHLPDEIAKQVDNDVVTKKYLQENSILALCHVAEGEVALYFNSGGAREWQMAAGHAILRGVGKKIVSCSSGQELGYNKVGFEDISFVAS